MPKNKISERQQSLNKQYNKAMRLLKQRVRTQEKRGYTGFTAPKRPKTVTEASIRRIQSIGAEQIRNKSKITINGKTVSAKTKTAKLYEAQKRKEKAKKGWETRRRKAKQAKDEAARRAAAQMLQDEEKAIEKAKKQAEEKAKTKENQKDDIPNRGEVILDNLYDMIENAREVDQTNGLHTWAADELEDMLDSLTMSEAGYNKVIQNCLKFENTITSTAHLIVESSDVNEIKTQYLNMYDLITGETGDGPWSKEKQEFADSLEHVSLWKKGD